MDTKIADCFRHLLEAHQVATESGIKLPDAGRLRTALDFASRDIPDPTEWADYQARFLFIWKTSLGYCQAEVFSGVIKGYVHHRQSSVWWDFSYNGHVGAEFDRAVKAICEG